MLVCNTLVTDFRTKRLYQCFIHTFQRVWHLMSAVHVNRIRSHWILSTPFVLGGRGGGGKRFLLEWPCQHTYASICFVFLSDVFHFIFLQFGLDLVLAFLPSFHMSRQFFALFVFQIQFRLPHNLFIRTWWRTERTNERTHISIV